MASEPDNERDRKQSREASLASIKAKLEQARTSGKSPEQIQELVTAFAREQMHQQIPQVATKVRSWWIGFRRFLIVGALAFGFAIGLALYVEHHYAAPLCEHYAAQHRLTYQGIYYPVIGSGSSTTSSGSCIFFDSTSHRSTVLLSKVEPNQTVALLTSFALEIDFTIPAAFILIALIAVKVFKIR